MTRKEFLNSLGLGAAFVLTTNCLNSCSKDNTTTATVDFTIDLADATNATLAINGSYVVRNNAVIARTNDGNLVAATLMCSHEGQKKVTYNKDTNEYLCTAHDARFDLQGAGLNSKGNKGLTIFQTSLTGTILRVFS
jgi:cytochrome b6-f complex iron-sulfur subunit